MALNKNRFRKRSDCQIGMTIIEVMIAILILIAGVLGVTALILTAIGANAVSRQQSTATVVVQTIMEKIMSVPANSATTLSITDCSTNAAQSVSTAVGGPTNPADFTASTVSGYHVDYITCGSSGLQITYDVRWNITAVTGSSTAKKITVSAQQKNAGSNPQLYAPAVTISSVLGVGS